MIVAKVNGKFMVLDSLRRVVKISVPLKKLDEIFDSYWHGTQRDDAIITDYKKLTNEAGSYKALKHYVAGYLLVNEIKANVPKRYVRAYEMNKHLYIKEWANDNN